MVDSDRLSLARWYAAWFWGVVGLLLAFGASPIQADEVGWEAAKRPGVAFLMRHALAPGTGDPANFALEDCSTQRNLNDAGRDQARRVGEAFTTRGIEVDLVLTSQWCRCRETAELLDLGTVEDFPALNSFFQDRSTAAAQTSETLAYLKKLPDGQRPFLVTHQVNITALTKGSVRSGEVIVVDVSDEGDVDVLGRILIDP
jgi:phosphohistidine phosphatase SixA